MEVFEDSAAAAAFKTLKIDKPIPQAWLERALDDDRAARGRVIRDVAPARSERVGTIKRGEMMVTGGARSNRRRRRMRRKWGAP